MVNNKTNVGTLLLLIASFRPIYLFVNITERGFLKNIFELWNYETEFPLKIF